MNDIQKMNTELENMSNELSGSVGLQKMLKFKKGQYFCDGEEISLGSQMIAHCVGWTKAWVKFEDGQLKEKRLYRVTQGERAPLVNQMPDRDESKWKIGINDKPADPWVLQYLLPMQNPETDEVRIFVTSSNGGVRAVEDLCDRYIWQKRRKPESGQPLIRLQKTMMPTKKFGNVVRPSFEIVGWTNEGGEPIREIS